MASTDDFVLVSRKKTSVHTAHNTKTIVLEQHRKFKKAKESRVLKTHENVPKQTNDMKMTDEDSFNAPIPTTHKLNTTMYSQSGDTINLITPTNYETLHNNSSTQITTPFNTSPTSEASKRHTKQKQTSSLKAYFASEDHQYTPKPLEAVHIGTFTSKKQYARTNNINHHPTIKEQEKSIKNIPIKTNERKLITCRFKLHVDGGSCNLPSLVKSIVKLYRTSDPS